MDPKAISHALMHSDLYEKPRRLRRELIRMMGEGVLIAEGDKHRAQRRLMNPAFGPGQVREFTSIFLDKANEVCISSL
jgi:cytochrome P450